MQEDGWLPKFRVFTIFALFFIAGIAIASIITLDFIRSLPVFIFALSALTLAGIINLLLKNRWLAIISFAFFSLIIGLLYYSFYNARVTPSLVYGEKLDISGQIVKNPDSDYKSQKITVKIDEAKENGKVEGAMAGKLVLVSMPHFPEVHYGEEISFSGIVEKPGIINDFDYGKYLRRYLIFGTVSGPENPIAVQTNLNFIQKIKSGLYGISAKFEDSLNQILPEPDASLAAGLILGVKRNIPQDFQDALSATGLTHIIALSGYNVTIIISVIAEVLLWTFCLPRKKVFWIGSVLVVLFILMTGGASSVVRAAIFSLLVLFGKTIGRRADFTNLILLAAVIMLFVNPYLLLLDVGFQLSFLAFCGLVYISPVLQKILSKEKYDFIPEFIKPILTETLAAQIAVFPLILVVFGRVSLISPISNILVIWIVPFAMAASFIAGLAGLIWYPLGKATLSFTWPLLEYIIRAVYGMAGVPGASFAINQKSYLLALALYALIIGGVFWQAKRYKISY